MSELPKRSGLACCGVRGAGSRRARSSSDRARADREDRPPTPSPREREVMEGLLEGKLDRWIADDLSISVRTVEILRARVLNALQAKNGSDAVRMVLSSPSYRDWLLRGAGRQFLVPLPSPRPASAAATSLQELV
ncbi:hypothetical protein HFP89_04205 [Wenzhouxiangella sp. XN79A]|uniref:LuxR C-terminal-related transcriptional regulator n=1 Tax=Wenzhouxiangella sp. XN79A TaxID=2724193 RepID=UPI00144A6609|nr:LuxR C-terminal-related transcriptional regulator [Wenzhouxiangella sp. XN79A]NKI34362.1 hypothetical protein [Wenzhouxiangella sp. XN79A]